MTGRPRRSRGLLGAGVLLAAGLAVPLAVSADGRPAPVAEVPEATAPVTRTSLVQTTSVDGTLGFDDAREITTRAGGTVTALPAEGSTVVSGGTLYELDARPVVLLTGRVPAYRTLAVGAEGEDVRQLEAALRALGHSGFTVDREYTAKTAAAVRRWQGALGLPRSGEVELGRVLFVAAPVRIASAAVDVGAVVQPGEPVLTATGLRRVVTVDLPVSERHTVRTDARVGVVLPDDRRVDGTVERISAAAEQDDSGSQGPDGDGPQDEQEATVEVVVAVDARAAASFDAAPVQVELEADRRDGVLTVPVLALLALPEGGHGVRVVEDGRARLVAVETGMFASGRVEVSGEGLSEGLQVEVPS